MMSSIIHKITQAGDKPGALIRLTEEEMEYLKNEMKQCPEGISLTEIKDRHREQLTLEDAKLADDWQLSKIEKVSMGRYFKVIFQHRYNDNRTFFITMDPEHLGKIILEKCHFVRLL